MIDYCLGTKGYRICQQGKTIISAQVHIVETARLDHPRSRQHAETASEVIVPGAPAAKPHQHHADDNDQWQRQQQPAALKNSSASVQQQQHVGTVQKSPTPADSTVNLGEPAGTEYFSANEGADGSTADNVDGLQRNPQRSSQPTRQLTQTTDIATLRGRMRARWMMRAACTVLSEAGSHRYVSATSTLSQPTRQQASQKQLSLQRMKRRWLRHNQASGWQQCKRS
jgi:hypothetical protein